MRVSDVYEIRTERTKGFMLHDGAAAWEGWRVKYRVLGVRDRRWRTFLTDTDLEGMSETELQTIVGKAAAELQRR